jgi:hypothetical protein
MRPSRRAERREPPSTVSAQQRAGAAPSAGGRSRAVIDWLLNAALVRVPAFG